MNYTSNINVSAVYDDARFTARSASRLPDVSIAPFKVDASDVVFNTPVAYFITASYLYDRIKPFTVALIRPMMWFPSTSSFVL